MIIRSIPITHNIQCFCLHYINLLKIYNETLFTQVLGQQSI